MNYSGEIASLEDLQKISKSVQTNNIKLSDAFQYYRGHGCCSYKLLSYISRFFIDVKKLQSVEENLIDNLKEKIKQSNNQEYFYIPPNSNGFDQNWYWLTQAQHLGIPTRLLDWTLSSEIALYFAVSDNTCKNQDGDFWIFFVPDKFNIHNQPEIISSIKPLQNDKDLFISIPVHWNKNYEKNEPQRNMLSQQGKFFIRSLLQSLIPLEDETFFQKYLLRYKIPAANKNKILEELTQLNYSNHTIYKTVNKTMNDIKEKLILAYNLKTK
jgi:hypothetical protein